MEIRWSGHRVSELATSLRAPCVRMLELCTRTRFGDSLELRLRGGVIDVETSRSPGSSAWPSRA